MTSTPFACIFPGQGSQKIGMLDSLLETDSEVVANTFEQASNVLGYDLLAVATTEGNSRINMTETTQPLLLSASYVVWQLLQAQNMPQPLYLAGHSLGEWSALVAAEVIAFTDAVALVAKRGAYMQSACKPGDGDMFAIVGLSDEKVIACCEQASSVGYVVPANFNAAGQVVISGEVAATARAVELCKQQGAKMAVSLPVSAPFHTELMRKAAEQLSEDIVQVTFNNAKIAIIHNASVDVASDANHIKQLMVQQICSPVPWVKTIESMEQSGVTHFVECGPGNVLAGLNKRINKKLRSLTTRTQEEISTTILGLI